MEINLPKLIWGWVPSIIQPGVMHRQFHFILTWLQGRVFMHRKVLRRRRQGRLHSRRDP